MLKVAQRISMMSLNGRHKIGLFITATAAGISLLAGSSLREAAGVVVIGLALAWALGASNRALHACLATAGLILLLEPLVAAIIGHLEERAEYNRAVAAWEGKLPELAKQNPDLSAGFVNPPSDPFAAIARPVTPPGAAASGSPVQLDFSKARSIAKPPLPPGTVLTEITRTIFVPGAGDLQFPVSMPGKQIAATLRAKYKDVPNWYLEALAVGVDAGAINSLDNPGWIVLPPSIGDEVASGYPLEVSGVILAAFFIGAIILETKKRKTELPQARSSADSE
jgi:hypothetical protein